VKLTDFGLASSTLKLEKTAPGVIYGKVPRFPRGTLALRAQGRVSYRATRTY